MRYQIAPVGAEFRIWDSLRRRWADDGYYQSLTDAERARDALACVKNKERLATLVAA